ncbi:MAG: hypothetical protein HY701_12460 [Gemmatimonadetes bacterium]|nr:hypothetical protein [Gemmatimonadota bacterium]
MSIANRIRGPQPIRSLPVRRRRLPAPERARGLQRRSAPRHDAWTPPARSVGRFNCRWDLRSEQARRRESTPGQGSGLALRTLSGRTFLCEAEVIDLRTLRPLDDQTIFASVAKTRRAMIVDEGWKSGGLSAEISARITESVFYDLDAPIARLCGAGRLDAVVVKAAGCLNHGGIGRFRQEVSHARLRIHL